jgi:hypothetical protein
VKPASINLQKWVLSPTVLINLGFILRGDLLLCSSYLPLGVPYWAVIYTPSVPWATAAAAPPPSTSSTLVTAGGRRRAKLVRLTAAARLCLLVRPGAERASPPSAARYPTRPARRPRTPCSFGGAGCQGGGPGTLDGWADVVAAGAAQRLDLRARACGHRLSAPGTASVSVGFASVRGGLWRCLIGGMFGAIVFIPVWCG